MLALTLGIAGRPLEIESLLSLAIEIADALDAALYEQLRNQVLRRDGWRCQTCGAMSDLEVHHQKFRSQAGNDSEQNLVTVCAACHAKCIMVDRSGERAAASDRLETDILPSEPTSDTEEEMVAMQPTRPMRLSSERL